MPRAYNILIVSGFVGTGSSALISILKGVASVTAFQPEFKIFAGPDGLYEVIRAFGEGPDEGMRTLHNFGLRIIEEGKSPHYLYRRANSIIRAFRGRDSYPRYRRRSYDDALGGAYAKVTKAYLRRLTEELPDLDSNAAVQVVNSATSAYFQELSRHVDTLGSCRNVIFNQTIKPDHHTKIGLAAIRQARVIVVDRDPRDQFLDLADSGRLESVMRQHFRFTGNLTHDFSTWYRSRRESFYRSIPQHPRLLVVNFENLCLDYSKVLEEVLNFVGLATPVRFRDRQYFDRDMALQKVGMWRHADRRIMERIERQLPEFCSS